MCHFSSHRLLIKSRDVKPVLYSSSEASLVVSFSALTQRGRTCSNNKILECDRENSTHEKIYGGKNNGCVIFPANSSLLAAVPFSIPCLYAYTYMEC